MKQRNKLGVFLFYISFAAVIPIFIYGQSATFHPSSTNTGFNENKGQIIDQDNNLNPGVLYLLNTPGMNVQLRRGGFSYDVYSIKKEAQRHEGTEAQHYSYAGTSIQDQGSSIRFHRIDFDLVGSNPNYKIITSEPSTDYRNYYTTGTPVEGITFVRSFQSVTYKNIHPNVDLEFLIDDTVGFKYNFIVHPDGKRGCTE